MEIHMQESNHPWGGIEAHFILSPQSHLCSCCFSLFSSSTKPRCSEAGVWCLPSCSFLLPVL